MTAPQQTTDPTGLDYQEAYKAMFPGLHADGIKLQTVQDSVLKTVDRAARLRRAERERVKQAFSKLAVDLEFEALGRPFGSGDSEAADRIRKLIEEIR